MPTCYTNQPHCKQARLFINFIVVDRQGEKHGKEAMQIKKCLVRGGRHQRGGAQGLGREMKALHDRQDDDA